MENGKILVKGSAGNYAACSLKGGEILIEKKIKIIAVEPEDSPVLSGGSAGPHKIQGIGAGFVPKILNKKSIDEIIQIANETAFRIRKS